jgi:hypothetical protein
MGVKVDCLHFMCGKNNRNGQGILFVYLLITPFFAISTEVFFISNEGCQLFGIHFMRHGSFCDSANLNENMTRILLSILLVFSVCAVVANEILVTQFNTISTVMVQEESSEDKPAYADGKEAGKEKITMAAYGYQYTFNQFKVLIAPDTALYYSAGFGLVPYNPPEAFCPLLL